MKRQLVLLLLFVGIVFGGFAANIPDTLAGVAHQSFELGSRPGCWGGSCVHAGGDHDGKKCNEIYAPEACVCSRFSVTGTLYSDHDKKETYFTYSMGGGCHYGGTDIVLTLEVDCLTHDEYGEMCDNPAHHATHWGLFFTAGDGMPQGSGEFPDSTSQARKDLYNVWWFGRMSTHATYLRLKLEVNHNTGVCGPCFYPPDSVVWTGGPNPF